MAWVGGLAKYYSRGPGGAIGGSWYRPGSNLYATRKPMKYKIPRSVSRRGASSTQRQINSLNRRVGGFMGLEMKFFDNTLGETAITSLGSLGGGEFDPVTEQCLNSMIQGNGQQERLGRFITMHSISVKGEITMPAVEEIGGPPQDIHVMVYLVLDTQTNGAQLSSENVFTNPGANVKNATDLFMNMEHTDRFRVLGAKSLLLRPYNMNEGSINIFAHGRVVKPFRINYRFGKKGKKVLFKTGAGGNVTSIEDNSLHIIVFNNQGTAGLVGIEYNSRLRFTTS